MSSSSLPTKENSLLFSGPFFTILPPSKMCFYPTRSCIYHTTDGVIKLVEKLLKFIFESRLLPGEKIKYSGKESKGEIRESQSALFREVTGEFGAAEESLEDSWISTKILR